MRWPLSAEILTAKLLHELRVERARVHPLPRHEAPVDIEHVQIGVEDRGVRVGEELGRATSLPSAPHLLLTYS